MTEHGQHQSAAFIGTSSGHPMMLPWFIEILGFTLYLVHLERLHFQMHRIVPRLQSAAVERDLAQFPVVALVGPRQCGKTTLARVVADRLRDTGRGALWLDLERPSDLAKLQDPELFFRRHATEVVCLDEVQRLPKLFE